MVAIVEVSVARFELASRPVVVKRTRSRGSDLRVVFSSPPTAGQIPHLVSLVFVYVDNQNVADVYEDRT